MPFGHTINDVKAVKEKYNNKRMRKKSSGQHLTNVIKNDC